MIAHSLDYPFVERPQPTLVWLWCSYLVIPYAFERIQARMPLPIEDIYHDVLDPNLVPTIQVLVYSPHLS